MSKKKVFLAVAMIGLILTTSACGKKTKKNENNNNGQQNVVSPTPTGPIANTNTGVINETVIDGLKIDNISLISENGAATFSATITNTNAQDVYVRSLSVIMKDANGVEITTIPGFVGSTLEPNQSYTITTNKYMDITTVASIEYIINR